MRTLVKTLRRLGLIGIAVNMVIISGCTPFQVNLPGSCSIFSNTEKPQQFQHDSSIEKKKKRI